VLAEAVATSGRTTILRTAVDQMQTLIVEKDRLLMERQALLIEKDVMAEELQHRVRNNLQLVSGMLRQQTDLNDGRPKEGLRSIAQRVMSLAKVYDHLLGNGLSRVVDFDQYMRSLCASLRAFQGEMVIDNT
jgi:two-component sensor histidine kinase